jgi:WD40 repeat protein
MYRLWLVFVALILLLASVPPAAAERRVALVVGNDAYEHLPSDRQLHNAVNDARSVKAALEQLGFTVIVKEDVRRADLVDALSDFAARIGKDDIAFFFYAGHGVSLNGANYILPTDISAPRANGRDEEARLADNALAETRVIERMKDAGARVALVVLDACRDNPLAATGGRTIGGSRGLAPPPEGEGLMSIYSAGIGQSAWDRLDDSDGSKNSVFTRVFVDVLKTPGLDLQGVARETRRQVAELARSVGKTQTPGYYEQIDGEVFLAGRKASVAASTTTPTQDEIAYSMIEGASDPKLFENFIARFPASSLRVKAQAALDEVKRRQTAALSPEPSAKPSVLASPQQAGAVTSHSPQVPPPPSAEGVRLIPQFVKGSDGTPENPHYVERNVDAVAFSGDRRSILSLSGGTLKFWDITTGRVIDNIVEQASAADICAIAVSRNGQSIVAGHCDHSTDGNHNTLTLWSTVHGIVQKYQGHTEHVSSIAFSPDERTFISSSRDGTTLSLFRSYHGPLKLWDTASGRLIRSFKGQDAWIDSVAFSPNGHNIVSGDDNNHVKLWDTISGRLIRVLEGHAQAVWAVAFSPDGHTVLSGSGDNSMKLWDVASGRLIRTFEGHTEQVFAVAFSPDGHTVLSGSGDKSMKLWDVASGRLIRTIEGHSELVNSIAFSPYGRSVLSGSGDGTTRLWDVESGQLRITFFARKENWDPVAKEDWAAFTPDGSFVTNGDPKILFKVAQDGKEVPLDDDFIARHRRDTLVDTFSVSK